jgi:hypothetical protein
MPLLRQSVSLYICSTNDWLTDLLGSLQEEVIYLAKRGCAKQWWAWRKICARRDDLLDAANIAVLSRYGTARRKSTVDRCKELHRRIRHCNFSVRKRLKRITPKPHVAELHRSLNSIENLQTSCRISRGLSVRFRKAFANGNLVQGCSSSLNTAILVWMKALTGGSPWAVCLTPPNCTPILGQRKDFNHEVAEYQGFLCLFFSFIFSLHKKNFNSPS